MLRIEVLRIMRFLWVAWCEDDYRNRSAVALGLTKDQAWWRCVLKYEAPQEEGE